MQNSMLRKSLVFGIIVLFVGAGVIPSMGRTIVEKHVSQDNKTSFMGFNPRGDILYVGGTGEGNYTRIQDAIDDASDGDMVFVYDDSSPYHEFLVVDKSINLIGENRDTTVIDGDGLIDVVHISTNGVNISGFTLQNSGEHWQNAGITIDANNAIVSNNIIYDCCDGINLADHRGNNVISDNTISSSSENGIRFWVSCNNNLILNNTIHSNKDSGIKLGQHCKNNNILGNDIYSNRVGVYIANSNNNMISDNIFSSNKDIGMLIDGSDNTVCNNSFSNDGLQFWVDETEKNIVTNNTVNNKPLVYLEDESDIVIDVKAGQIILVYCDNITIQNQELTHTSNGIQIVGADNCFIYDNILSDNNRGIDLTPYSYDNNIVGNTISNNSYGIHGPSFRGNIEGNTISNNGHGIFLYACWGNNIYSNLISNNLYGLKIWWVTPTVNNISFNNFIDNKRNAGFHLHFVNRHYINWSNNYWDRPRLLPKLIFGKMSWRSSRYYIPWINIDWHPAKEPYDIEV